MIAVHGNDAIGVGISSRPSIQLSISDLVFIWGGGVLIVRHGRWIEGGISPNAGFFTWVLNARRRVETVNPRRQSRASNVMIGRVKTLFRIRLLMYNVASITPGLARLPWSPSRPWQLRSRLACKPHKPTKSHRYCWYMIKYSCSVGRPII